KHVSEMEIGRQLLQEIVSYAETSICRRKFILHYFGEDFDEESCNGMCDNCRYPKEQFEGMDSVKLLLDAIHETKERHRADHIVDVLRGEETTEVKTYRDDQREVFSAGIDHEAKY